MPAGVQIVLLRGINVGGHKMVAMAELRAFLIKLGCTDAQPLLQSGNVVVRGAPSSGAAFERLLEAQAKKQLGLEADFFVRTGEEWASVIARNPFKQEAARDPARLVATVFRDALEPKAVKALQASIAGREVVRADGKHAYIVYPDGMGRSRLTHAILERTLGTRGTARNWNTVLKLGALANQ